MQAKGSKIANVILESQFYYWRNLMPHIYLLVILLLGSQISFSNPIDQFDCEYRGVGKIYVLSGSGDGYVENVNEGFQLHAVRKPLPDGTFLFFETKTYADNRPQEKTVFKQSLAIGPNSFLDPTGSFTSYGFCTRPGHCMGTMKISSISFVGHFVTDFDEKGIRTVTHASDGSLFADEVLSPVQGTCPYVIN